METPTLENPVIRDGMDELDAIAAKAAELEANPQPEPSAEPSEPRATDTTAQPNDNPETRPEVTKTDERPRDEFGRFTKREDGSEIPEAERQPAEQPQSNNGDVAPAGDAKPESAYVKAQKDRERFDRNWQKFEQEREEFRREREQWRQELTQARQQSQPQQQQQRPQFSSEDYATYAADLTAEAEQLLKDGDYEKAAEVQKKAAQATNYSLQVRKQEMQQIQVGWQQRQRMMLDEDAAEVLRSVPEMRDENSPLAKEAGNILSEYQELIDHVPRVKLRDGRIVGGVSLATEFAKLRLQAGSASGLTEENKKLKAQVEELNKKLRIDGSGPTSPTQQKSLNELPPEQAMEEIERRAARMAA